MTTLSARYIRIPRRRHECGWCGRSITGPHLYLYGMADSEPPWSLRLHLVGSCRPSGDKDSKVAAALAAADKESETSI